MAARCITTVLFITRHLIARADFARRQELIELRTQPRPDVQDWPTLVEIALGMGPKPGRDTYVLCSDIWTQTLSLTGVATKKMAASEIAAALNFEAETLSGQSAFESTVAAHALPGESEFWIVQPRTEEFALAEEIIRQAGSRMAGLTHPGGLPAPLNDSAKTGPWSRIEFWPDAVFFLAGKGHDSVQLRVINADPQTRPADRWATDWDGWRQQSGPAAANEALTGPGVFISASSIPTMTALDKDAELSAWLTAWVKHLHGKPLAAPLLRPAKKPMSTALRAVVAVALAALVLIGCGLVHRHIDQTLQRADADLQQMQAKIGELKNAQKQVDELKGKHTELSAQIDGFEWSVKVLSTHRQRLARFLTKLSELHPEHLHVEKIDFEAGEPRLRGHCLQPELADQFANQLAQALTNHGWEVQTPKKVALQKSVDGAPWSFDIQLKSVKEMTLETRMDTKKGKGR